MRLLRHIIAATMLLSIAYHAPAVKPQDSGMAEVAMDMDMPDSLRRTYRHSEAVQRLAIYRDTLTARQTWQQLIEEDSTYAPAHHYLSLTERNRARATDHARRAYKTDSTNKWYVQNYGWQLLQGAHYAEALPIYRHLLHLDNGNLSTYHTLAILYGIGNMPYSAISIIDSAELRLGRNEYLSDIKQDLLMDTHQYNRAIDEGVIIIEESPYNVAAHTRLAYAYEAAGRDTLARDMFERAYAIDTTNLEATVEVADFYKRHGDYPRMFHYEERLFRDNRLSLDDKLHRLEQYTSNRQFYVQNFFNVGRVIMCLVIDYPNDRAVIMAQVQHLLASGSSEAALEYMRSHLDDENATAEDYITTIQLEYLVERKELIANDLARGIARFPENLDLRSFEGFHASENKEYDRAIKTFRSTLRYATEDAERSSLWGYIGDTYHAMGETKRCFKAYDKALGYNKNNALVLNNYAYFLSLIDKDLERALDYSSRAIYLDENNPTYLDSHAWVLHRLGRNNEAKRIMRQALSLDGQRSAELLAHYGDILWALGEKFMAETYWEKAVERGYNSAEMEKHISEVRGEK